MIKHKDLLTVLRSNKMRITPARRALLQYILDHKNRQFSMADFHAYMERILPGVDRSSVYRNIEAFKKLEIIQELSLPERGKRFQYIFDRKVHHFYICKACGKSNRGNEALFRKIEEALKEVHGFSKANLSLVFYGHCAKCARRRPVSDQ